MTKLFKITSSAFLFLANLCFSRDMGVYGEVFEIAETDFIDAIQSKLQALEKNGDLLKSQREIQKRIIENAQKPRAVSDIIHTKTERIFEYDPTIELTVNLTDHQGKVFAKKGTKYNPCDYATFSKTLLFIDGECQWHINWLKSRLKSLKNVQIILVAGRPISLSEQLDMPVYFDQYGTITRKLGIKQVPALVFQKPGKRVLTIREEKIDEN